MNFDLNFTTEQMGLMSFEEKKELLELLKVREEYYKYRKIELFKPLPFQKTFFAASKKYHQRFLMAANRVGKSYSEAMEMSMHLTGKYPEWYEGKRFDKPISAWAIGITNDSTRKVLQKELFGTIVSRDEKSLGTGSIPRADIDFETMEQERNLIKVCRIKHHDAYGEFDGWSTLEFRSTQQGQHALMGANIDYIWMDEEDPYDSLNLYMQCLTRTMTCKGYVTLTATPENGRTALIDKFYKTPKKMYMLNATWEDACEEIGGHLERSQINEMLESLPEIMRDMRSKGIPTLGSGMVYLIRREDVEISPFMIPDHWKQIAAIDIGFDHPTAVVWTAYDAERDTIYVVDCYKRKGAIPSEHASAINRKGRWIPVVLPHDSQNTEKGSGVTIADLYKDAGVNALPDPFYNPIVDGKKNYFVRPGILEIQERLKDGRFRIFSNCIEIFEEMQKYHFDEGKPVKVDDDLMDAMRYSALSVTHRGKTKSSANSAYSRAYNRFDYDY